MAGYVANRLSLLQGSIGGLQRIWTYQTADSIATVAGAGYISDAANKRMQIGDLVLVFTGTLNTTGPDQVPSTKARGVVSEFASDPSVAWFAVDSISSGAATLKEVMVQLGGNIGFYGATPVSQRAAAAQATSNVGTASSTALDTNTKAALIEVMNTLAGLGLWKGSA